MLRILIEILNRSTSNHYHTENSNYYVFVIIIITMILIINILFFIILLSLLSLFMKQKLRDQTSTLHKLVVRVVEHRS